MPSDKAIEACLRRIVRTALNEDEEITVRLARSRAEEELDLDEGFLKEGRWKDKSKDIITQAWEGPQSDHVKSPQASKKRAQTTETKAQRPAKRCKSTSSPIQSSSDDDDELEQHEPSTDSEDDGASEQAKDSMSENEDKSKVEEDSDTSEGIDESPKQRKKHSKVSQSKATSNESTAAAKRSTAQENSPIDEAKAVDEESEMSEVLDEPPKPKKRRSKGETKSSTKKSSTATTSKSLSPDEEQVKLLQSQLVKCGVRKMWHQELKHCGNDKAKISHLRGMLRDVGMTGRFSAARAEEIKEARELAEELEAAKQFEKNWGTEGRVRGGRRSGAKPSRRVEDDSEVDEESEAEPPSSIKAGAATGLVDFGDSGDDYSD